MRPRPQTTISTHDLTVLATATLTDCSFNEHEIATLGYAVLGLQDDVANLRERLEAAEAVAAQARLDVAFDRIGQCAEVLAERLRVDTEAA